ncbi:DUF4328 domain-containing protein [Williamsia herbipolensis]|uniref:DUF4328 domain-containing protein n=1 Tax=Williamsia herbipolensis TaxID=1603258 RepID=A0AAU4JX49_9NOCA|nr:DUF4328 domain-containing protein [Williamsia herbipolensis]
MVLDGLDQIPPRPAAAPAPPRPRPAPPRPRPVPTARRDPRIRWEARRPPEARPAPRGPRPVGLGPTPRYSVPPRWGLVDVITPAEEPRPSRLERLAGSLTPLLQATGSVLLVAAFAEAWIYALLIRNRTAPVGATTAGWAYAITWALGVVSIVMVVASLLSFTEWLRRRRAEAFAEHDRLDPRPTWHLVVGCLVPVVNIVAPAVFLHELARCGHALPADRVMRVLRLWWAAWAALSALAIGTLVIRYASDSIQWGANAVLLTVVCDLAGAAFAVVSSRLLVRAFDPDARPEPSTRWLAA